MSRTTVNVLAPARRRGGGETELEGEGAPYLHPQLRDRGGRVVVHARLSRRWH